MVAAAAAVVVDVEAAEVVADDGDFAIPTLGKNKLELGGYECKEIESVWAGVLNLL